MAYGLKYTQYIEKGGALVRINVYEKDWTGGSYGMAHVVGASLQIIGGQSNVIAPIIKTAFSFSLVDAFDEGTPNSDGTTCINPDGEKCGQWEEFFTPDATKYKVEVTSKPAPGASESVIWTGFITPDSWSENMIYRGVITVTARDMIGALQEKEFDLTGRVSVRDLIAGAMSACECPMQLQLTEAHFLTNSNGNSILDHNFAASVFAGDTWYQALEDTLDSLGLVLRYNGANRIVLTSLRYIAGDTTRGSHEIEFVSRSGLRQLDPAIRSITETFDASLVRLAVDDPDPSQYTATGEYNVQRAPCSYSLPHDVNIPRYTLTGPIQPTEWLGSLAVPRPTQIYQGGGAIPEREIYFPTDIITEGVSATVQTNNIKAPFSFRINQDGPVMRYQVNGATTIVSALAKFQDIALSKIHVVIGASVDGQARYLGADGAWSTAQTIHEIDPGAEVVVPALSGGEGFAIIITKLDTAYTGDWQLPVSTVVALNVELSPAQSSTTPTEFKTTTEYDQANNVVITRKPKIGSASISSSAPFAENVLAYGDDLAADEWNWPGEDNHYPLAVMIQAQVLCYYSAPASIFTGTAHDKATDAAAALPGYMFEYYDRDGVILSGTYGFTAGFISQINAREVYGWEDVWGAGFDPEYTAQSGAGKGSTSATGPGGGSASSGGSAQVQPAGVNYFEPNEDRASLIQLKAAYDYLGPRKGLVFGETAEADVENSPAHLMLRNFGTAQNPKYALYTPFALVTGGDQIVINGEPGGGGGGGGVMYLSELLDVSLANLAGGQVLSYDSTAQVWKNRTLGAAADYGVTNVVTAGDTTHLVTGAAVATAVAAVLKWKGITTTDIAANPSANPIIINGQSYTAVMGDVVVLSGTSTEYLYNGSTWEPMGDEASYALKTVTITGTGYLTGGGTLEANRTLDIASSVKTKIDNGAAAYGYFSGGVLDTSHLPALYLGTTSIQTASAEQNVTGIGNLTMGWNKYLYMLDENGTAKEIARFYKSSTTTIMRFGGGNTGAAHLTILVGGSELRFQTGRSSATTHLSLTEGSTGSKSARLYGNLVMNNAAALYFYNYPAEGAQAQYFRAVYATTGNILYFGDGTIGKDYQTRVYGSPLAFYTGSSSVSAANRLTITADGIIRPYVDIVPDTNNAIDLGSATRFFAEAYAKKVYLSSSVYLEYVDNSGNGYVHINAPLVTDGDQIVVSGTPGGGGGGGSQYLWELLDVDSALVSPTNGVVLQYNATDGEWKGVASDTIGITTAGTVAELNAASPTTAKRVWSPSVLASWLAGKGFLTSAVTNIAVGGSGHTDELAITKGGTTSYLTVPYATNVVRFKRYDGTLDVQGGYDLNTLLSGGGITSQYNSMYTWGNGPTGMSFGGAVQLNPFVGQTLAMQLAWDVDHTNVKTGHLWWRDSIYKNSTHTWGEWHLIYDDTTLTKSVITGLLDAGNGTYVKLNPGSAEQTISSNISSLDKGVVNLWRKSGDHYTFLGFSNGTTETYLGGIGFKSQSDHNLYRKDGSNYYKIWDEANSNLASVNWACNNLSAAGNVTLANNKHIRWMSNPAAGASPEAILAIEFTTNNNLYIGYGVAVSGHYTRLYGNTIDFLTGSATRTTAFVLSDSDAKMYRTFVPSINNHYDLGSSELKWGTLHSNNGNFYNKVNIGSPSFSDGALNVNGAIVSVGDQVITSDIRVKRNLKPIELSVEQIASCRAVSFDWAAGGHSFGSVAQDWEPLVPEAVKQGDIKTLAYGQLALVAAINIAKHETEQDKEIRRLRERVADLEKEVKRLTA